VQLNELHAFCVYGVLVSYAFVMPFLCACYALVYRLFAAHLQHNKKVDKEKYRKNNT